MEISPLICIANQWTGFYIMTASVLKGLKAAISREIPPSSFFLDVSVF